MLNKKELPAIQQRFANFLAQYNLQEVSILLRSLYFSYLREISESGFPDNFHHDSCLVEQLLEVFDG